ncbi:MAG: hypothetical protein F4178_02050 [Rhodospirillaceae bacterium]|nr:hypothetical protein [Rhodospirillaceae bacterium]
MTDRLSPTLEDVFRTLDRWRHLPGYRLEPNLAPFFGLYLRDILLGHLGIETHPIIVPEFPLRLGTLYENLSKERPGAGENQSVQVDYATFSSDLKTVYLVELKTDEKSIDEEQKKYLRAAKEKDFNDLLSGIWQICTQDNLPSRRKYVHLIDNLIEVGLIKSDKCARSELYKKTFPKPESHWKKFFTNAIPEICGRDIDKREIKIVYISPSGNALGSENMDFSEIGFDHVADIVWKCGGIGREFAYYLKRWKDQAGEIDPRKLRSVP